MDVGRRGTEKKAVTEKEETFEELLKKLQNRGTRVKIIGDDEDASKQTPK